MGEFEASTQMAQSGLKRTVKFVKAFGVHRLKEVIADEVGGKRSSVKTSSVARTHTHTRLCFFYPAKKKEKRLTVSVLKQDPDTRKVQKNAGSFLSFVSLECVCVCVSVCVCV